MVNRKPKRYRHVVSVKYGGGEKDDRPGSVDWPTLRRAMAGAFIAAGHYLRTDDAIDELHLRVIDQAGNIVWEFDHWTSVVI